MLAQMGLRDSEGLISLSRIYSAARLPAMPEGDVRRLLQKSAMFSAEGFMFAVNTSRRCEP
jgi:hypothetical protein